ncbi:MAG: preprotein translocase subunit SecG [Deltaproteobacteria bacterium]|jgi:preprotein translocase subunit SecG|nr:preprotein translocase subunit SecG [Deltaproteobacteria bacterium]MBT4525794.1 preprotein translocase subunit SecG [Deltaproteobacteria bacterium]
MSTLILTIHIIVCVFIIFVVLLQVGRGAELGAAFGSVGQANASRGVTTFISKLTTFMAVAFMVTSFVLTYQTSDRAKTSVIDTVSQEEVSTPAIPDQGTEEAEKTE